MSSFSGSYRSCKPSSNNPRPTRMHEILDMDSFQPFEFEGERYYLDEDGFVRHRCMEWAVDEADMIKRLENAHILTAIINKPNSVRRSRVVDHVGIMEHLKALGMRYILRVGLTNEHYLFQDKPENVSYGDLFNWPPNILRKICGLYVPADSSLAHDLSTISRNIPMEAMIWIDGISTYAIDIDNYLKEYGGTKPFYEWS